MKEYVYSRLLALCENWDKIACDIRKEVLIQRRLFESPLKLFPGPPWLDIQRFIHIFIDIDHAIKYREVAL